MSNPVSQRERKYARTMSNIVFKNKFNTFQMANQTHRTYRATILRILQNPRTQITCSEICKRLIKRLDIENWKQHYLAGGVSSILNKLVKQGVLEYNQEKQGPRGGYVYQKRTDETSPIVLTTKKKEDSFHW